MHHFHARTALAIAGALLIFATPAAAQRAAKGSIRALPQRPATSEDLGKGQPLTVGMPLTIAKTLPDGRAVNLKLSVDGPPSANLRIVGAAFLPAEQTLVARIENKGEVASQEASLVAKILWGAAVDQEKLAIRRRPPAGKNDIAGPLVDEMFDKVALGINHWTAKVKPLAPVAQTIVAIDLPNVIADIHFCGLGAGKHAKTDCVDPATESVLSVTLVPGPVAPPPGA